MSSSLFIKPKEVFAEKIAAGSTKTALALLYAACLGCVIQMKSQAIPSIAGWIFSILVMAAILMAVLFLPVLVYRYVGAGLQGTGSSKDILIVVGWAATPIVLGFALSIAEIALTGKAMLLKNPEGPPALYWILKACEYIRYGLFVCHWILLVIGISVAHKFSIIKAFLTVHIPLIIFAVLIGTWIYLRI